jgi:type I restriction enzyme M protein
MNEPHYLTIPEGKICDFISGNFRNDTPEEYVRQNLEKRLVNELKYPRERIGVEVTLQLGSNKPRALTANGAYGQTVIKGASTAQDKEHRWTS